MVMLTGGQVSMAISSFIVIFFTALLFFAGYILQQQTVTSLRRSIAPRIPKPIAYKPPPLSAQNPLAKSARALGQSDGVDAELKRYLDTVGRGDVDWTRLAHVQLVRDHHEVCTAVMLFAELKRLKSPARRMLLFPTSWTKDITSDEGDPTLIRTRRLLRTAARRYNVNLRALDALPSREGHADPSLPSSYSLASLWSLTEYDRILYLQTPGLLLDSEPLDALLAFSSPSLLSARPTTSFSAPLLPALEHPQDSPSILSTSLLLLTPSHPTYTSLLTQRLSSPQSDLSLLRNSFPTADSILSPSSYYTPSIFAETFSLRQQPAKQSFNMTSFLDQTSYIRFTDPEFPGPEYTIPFSTRVEYRPENKNATIIWDRLYDVFRQRRQEVCGLDLDRWEKPHIGAVELGFDEEEEREERSDDASADIFAVTDEL